jgi:type II secretory pathway pseudopilin PulG
MSLDDRLSFGDSTLGGVPPEVEPEPAGDGGAGRPNRAFIFIAIAMGGLILLGVLALVGALTFVVPQQKARQAATITAQVVGLTQQAAAFTPTPSPMPTEALPTWTVTSLPTWTPIPTATATRVVQNNGPTPTNTATPTRSAATDWGAPTTTTPPAGLGGLGTAAIAVGLAGLVFAIRKLRSG